MPIRPKILVTSAAGKTGQHVVLQLLEKGYSVRAFVRQVDTRSDRLKAAGAEIFAGNLYAISDMRRAMDGVHRAYHCAPTAPNGLQFGAAFSIAAYESKLEHVVMLGQWLSQPDHPSHFTREVWMNEQILGLLPDTSLTTINVGWFAENYLMVLEPAVQLGVLPMPLGDGDVKRDVGPSNEAIASVVVGALIDPDTHAGQIYRPTGPKLLSPNDVAAAIGRVFERKVRYLNISENMFLKAFAALRPPMYSESNLTQLRIYSEEYRRGTFALGGPTDVVQTVGGMAPESFEDYVRRVAVNHPDAMRSFLNRARALVNFAKIIITPAPNPAFIAKQKDFVQLAASEFCLENAEWLGRYDNNPIRKTTTVKA